MAALDVTNSLNASVGQKHKRQWHDPWRRSPVPPWPKKVSISAIYNKLMPISFATCMWWMYSKIRHSSLGTVKKHSENWKKLQTETEHESGWKRAIYKYLYQNKPWNTLNITYWYLTVIEQLWIDFFPLFFRSATTNTAKKDRWFDKKWAWKNSRGRVEGSQKVKILPWSNIDCLCVMLSSTIWASHICGELLFQSKVDILGSACECGWE